MHDAVQPGCVLRLVLLHDRVRLLPVAALEQRKRFENLRVESMSF